VLTTHIEPTRTGRIRIAKRAVRYSSLLIMFYVLVYMLLPRHVRTLPPCEAIWWHRGEAAATAVLLVAIGVFMFAQSWRAFRQGQWPSPGTDVFVRVKILRGRQLWLLVANTVAYWAIVAWAISLAAPVLLPYLIHGPNVCNA